jgi:nucleoside-diphosphate-sugar epimerase
MMNTAQSKKGRILITGITGFVGRILQQNLEENGYEVWGISRSDSREERVFQADLRNYEQTVKAIEAIPDFSLVIHTAALAHNNKKQRGDSYLDINTSITRHVIDAVIEKNPVFIYISSVSVYGEADRKMPIVVEDELRPASEYGKSKVACEKMVQDSLLKHHHLLRVAPVYDETHSKDIRKRVFFPLQNRFKMVLKPAPLHSFCHLTKLSETVLNLVDNQVLESSIVNVADSLPCDQNELAARFKGINVIIPLKLIERLYPLTILVPKAYRYAVQCLYCKLFKSNIYA